MSVEWEAESTGYYFFVFRAIFINESCLAATSLGLLGFQLSYNPTCDLRSINPHIQEFFPLKLHNCKIVIIEPHFLLCRPWEKLIPRRII